MPLRRKVIIDCDPGIDDTLALTLAMRSPEIDVRAVTVVGGNVGLEACVRNARGVLALVAGTGAPMVAAGAARPLQREPMFASHVHGGDGLGGMSGLLPPVAATASGLDAVETILAIARAEPGEVTLVTLGPMTNAALALRCDAGAFGQLAGVVAMGGAFAVHGNITPVAEFNIYCDPHAVQAVIDSGVPVKMVGLDMTTRMMLTRERLMHASAGATAAVRVLMREICDYYGRFYRDRGVMDGCYLHDPFALATVVDPSLARFAPARVAVETAGEHTMGMTVVDRRPWSEDAHTADVCVEGDSERFLEMFAERVLG